MKDSVEDATAGFSRGPPTIRGTHRKKYPTKVVPGLEEALAWILPQLEGGPLACCTPLWLRATFVKSVERRDEKRGDMLGHDRLGAGPITVVVMNDWMCDTSTWNEARTYLDGALFTWVFTDLRGYGRSKELRGKFTVEEAAADVIELADVLLCRQFTIVGHSMSALIALHLAQHHRDRIGKAVVLTPPPPSGFGVDESALESIRALAHGDDGKRMNWLRPRLGDQMSEGWARFKVDRWRRTADPEAVAGYAAMFARDGLPEPTARIDVPLLAVTGEKDIDLMRRGAVTKLLSPISEQLMVTPLADCGHYPMQEAPPLLVGIVERFLGAGANGADFP